MLMATHRAARRGPLGIAGMTFGAVQDAGVGIERRRRQDDAPDPAPAPHADAYQLAAGRRAQFQREGKQKRDSRSRFK
jgi:hypothetical protein